MIYLYTGTPGHGKTQRAIFDLLNDKRFKGRRVYAANVRGLKFEDPRLNNWTSFDKLEDWQSVEEGAIILIDECHQLLPVRTPGRPPAHIEKLAEHRHKGIDFILITQSANNMDVHVRRLVEEHIHLKRVGQLPYTNVYTFQGVTKVDDGIPTSTALKHERWKLDKSIWTLYESADEHTDKVKIPRVVWLLPLVLIGLAVLVTFIYSDFSKRKEGDTTTVKAKKDSAGLSVFGVAPSMPPSHSSALNLYNSVREWQHARIPRDRAHPESAPVYDDVRQIKTFPRVSACVSMNGICRCYTQQGTSLNIENPVCLEIVAIGRFNPYYDEQAEREAHMAKQQQQQQQQQQVPPPSVAQPQAAAVPLPVERESISIPTPLQNNPHRT